MIAVTVQAVCGAGGRDWNEFALQYQTSVTLAYGTGRACASVFPGEWFAATGSSGM